MRASLGFALAALFATMAVAGCSTKDTDQYPGDYMLGTYGVPDGLVLARGDVLDQFAEELDTDIPSNPGYIDPTSFDDPEDPGPLPEKVYGAVYVNSDYDQDDVESVTAVVLSVAIRMVSDADADETVEDPEFCDDQGESAYALRDGKVFAALFVAYDSDGEFPASRFADAAEEMRSATGATDPCRAG
ncbi:MAG TPA: hypothetical protein VI796_04280 [Candidatus Thermoplasmatota archaeon]|nr:hypothetical protein [Candidatus Thermoplasmatota archaeon]